MTASWSAPIRVQPNTSVVRAIDRGQWQAPLGSSRGPTIRLLAACRRARVRQGQAFGGAEEAPSLTAAARDGDANMRSGRKNARGAGRTKEWNDKGRQKWRDASLTKKAPYKPNGGNTPQAWFRRSRKRGPKGNALSERQSLPFQTFPLSLTLNERVACLQHHPWARASSSRPERRASVDLSHEAAAVLEPASRITAETPTSAPPMMRKICAEG